MRMASDFRDRMLAGGTGGGPRSSSDPYYGGSRGGGAGYVDYMKPKSNSAKDMEWWLNNKSVGAVGDAQDDAANDGYYGGRSRGYDQEGDDRYGQYQDRMDDIYAEEAPDGGVWNDPGVFAGAEPNVVRGPQDEFSFSDYGDWQAGNGGAERWGSFDEGDLSWGDDPNNLLSASVPGLQDILKSGVVDSPDFDAMYNKYAEGSQGLFTRALRTGHEGILDSAAGGNRLKTGFYDEDVGRFETDLSRQFQDQALQKAVELAGVKQRDVESQRTSGIARGRTALDAVNLSLDAGKAAARNRIDRATNARANRMQARAAFEGDRTFAREGYEDTRDFREDQFTGDRAHGENVFQDRRDAWGKDREFSRGVFTGDRTFATDRFRDRRDSRIGIAGKQVGAAQSMSDTAYERHQQQKDRYLDYMTGAQDRATGRNEAEKNRKASFWNNLISTAGAVAGAAMPG